jgi:low temperature requirement protein LtrA
MSAPGADHEAEQRHASWLELFFDLVVVAGIGLLGHLLRDEDTAGVLRST